MIWIREADNVDHLSAAAGQVGIGGRPHSNARVGLPIPSGRRENSRRSPTTRPLSGLRIPGYEPGARSEHLARRFAGLGRTGRTRISSRASSNCGNLGTGHYEELEPARELMTFTIATRRRIDCNDAPSAVTYANHRSSRPQHPASPDDPKRMV
jgi:hypothetical protein